MSWAERLGSPAGPAGLANSRPWAALQRPMQQHRQQRCSRHLAPRHRFNCRAHAGDLHDASGPEHEHGRELVATDSGTHSNGHDHDYDHSSCSTHKHSHESDGAHAHSHSHEHSHEHSHGGSCGHSHGGTADLSNPAHRLLKRAYDGTRLTQAAGWLESSLPSTLAKIGLFVLAAGTAGWASNGWAAGAAHAHAAAVARSVSLAATAGVYVFAGLPAGVSLSYDVTAGRVDTHVLMNLAVLGTLATGHALEGALLLVLFQTSHVVEHLLSEKAQGNLAALYDSMPKTAVLVGLSPSGEPDMGSAQTVLAADVAVGDCMLVKPGEQIPLDGEVVHGRAMVSSEHITGESIPVLRRSGDEVAAGSLNRDGLLVVRALRRAEESTPARIAKLTLNAQAKRPQLRSWLDEFGEVYSKGVIAASLGLLVVLLICGVPLLGVAGQRGAFYRAMGLLTVAAPCALVMVPLAYVSAIAAIASRGILVKGGRVLDALAACSTVAFDKTGTLTTGSLTCSSLRPLGASSSSSNGSGGSGSSGSSGGGSTSSVLRLPPREAAAAKRGALAAAVALSLRSSHPVSDAIVLHGQAAGVDGSTEDVSGFRLVSGGGVEGTVSSSAGSKRSRGPPLLAALGSLDFVSAQLAPGEVEAVEKLAAGLGTSSVLSVLVLQPSTAADDGGGGSNGSSGQSGQSGRSVWVMSFEDTVRQQSAAAVRSLQTGSWTGSASQVNRMAVTMLTGDNEASAQRIARKLGITSVRAALSPEQKLAQVQELSQRSDSGGSSGGSSGSKVASGARSSARRQGKGGRLGGVIMVGDGINDAPALAAADVGVAIASSASAAASLAADVIVVNTAGIAAIPVLLQIAQATQAVIKQNLVLAAGSILALALPTMLGWVPLWFAVMLHEGSTLLVALNSLRLLRFGAPRARAASSAASASNAGSGQQQVAVAAPAPGGKAVGGQEGEAEPAAAAVAAVPPAA